MENILTEGFVHVSVMLNECIENLNINPNGIYVDGTLGGGGHSAEILKRLTGGKLIAIDKDLDAINHCKKKFENELNKIIFVNDDFKNYRNILESLGINKVDGVLLDLGVSSHQIDTASRGFSYRFNGKLDMRMNTSQNFSAYDVVNSYSEENLRRIIYTYGEDSFAKLIAKAIVNSRKLKPIETTLELVNVIESAVPKKFKIKGSVSKKTFQAIRIEVNGELENLDLVIKDMAESLNEKGRLAIITFHSLEDRIVKNVFKELNTNCICDKSVPICICNHKRSVNIVHKKPIVATNEELKNNKRSSSAKLRVVEKI